MNKKVAIAGFGIEGRSAYEYFSKLDSDITIFDEQPVFSAPADAKLAIAKDIFGDLNNFDVVVRSPSIRPDKIKTDGKVTSVTKEFFKVCPTKKIIGVTGSKGKGTTSTLIYKILEKVGIRAHLGGNIGVPALDLLPNIQPDDVVVLELSSFQLWDLDASPHIAVVLMVEPEHLDVHDDENEYLEAKANLVAHQKKDDLTIFLPGNDYVDRVIAKSGGEKIPYTQKPGAHVENGWFVIDNQQVCETKELVLRGQHNIDNACAAITAVWQYTQDTAAITSVLSSYGGLEHRLKFVARVHDVEYYDDSIATTPGSAIAALKAFEQPKIIILGGSDKGADFTELANVVAKSNVKSAILIGQMRQKLQNALGDAGFDNIQMLDEQAKMIDIVDLARKISTPGDVVILSPACASFGMFKNYKDRGDQFISAVKSLE